VTFKGPFQPKLFYYSMISHNPGIYTVLKMEMIHYLRQEKLYRLVAGDDNTDENCKVKNHLLSQKFH